MPINSDLIEDLRHGLNHDVVASIQRIQQLFDIVDNTIQKDKLRRLDEITPYIKASLDEALKKSETIHHILQIYSHREPAKELDTGLIFNKVFETFTALYPDRNISLVIDKTTPHLVVPQEQIVYIAQELIFNAISHHPEHPELVISVSAETQENGVTLMVADNGKGIEKDHEESVFNLFSKLDSVQLFDTHLGRGLSVIKAIMESMQGTAMFSSSQSGNTVTLFWPNSTVATATKTNSSSTSA